LGNRSLFGYQDRGSQWGGDEGDGFGPWGNLSPLNRLVALAFWVVTVHFVTAEKFDHMMAWQRL
jgi:hypothetical protein